MRLASKLALLFFLAGNLHAEGIRWVAGAPQFKSRLGSPVIWQGTTVSYYTDPGRLSASVTHDAAVQMVNDAAATWNIPYSSLTLGRGGDLDQHVSTANTYIASTGVVFPQDVKSTSTKQIAILFDDDGSITDLLLGSGASSPLYCRQNVVTESVDKFLDTGYIAHALIVLNGRCTGTNEQLLEMKYQLIRRFGRVLGLGWSQLNDNVFTGNPAPTYQQALHWPLMHPIDIICGPYAYQCLPQPFTLRDDDISSLAHLYPTLATQAGSNNKLAVNNNAMWLNGTVSFPNGQGMQGVNVVVRIHPQFWPDTLPWETVSSVTGSQFTGNAGSVVAAAPAGMDGSQGVTTASMQGAWAVARIPHVTTGAWETYDVYGQSINPLYVGQYSVGPYRLGQVSMSGSVSITTGLVRTGDGGTIPLTANDAVPACKTNDGTETSPSAPAASGWWTTQTCGYGHAVWLSLKPAAGHTFTVEVTALDESGSATTSKAMPVFGLWKQADTYGSMPTVASATQAFNSGSVGTTSLRVASATTSQSYRLAIADQRGDGRPDFAYQARFLYLDSVTPNSLQANGGTITIRGTGFKKGNAVLIGGVEAEVTTWTPTSIVAVAPPLKKIANASTWTGDVTVLDVATKGSSTAASALTYIGGTVAVVTDELELVSGGQQSIPSTGAFGKVVLHVTDGAGKSLANAKVEVHQMVSGYTPVCVGSGRCPVAPVYSSSSETLLSDSAGLVQLAPDEISDPEVTQIVATTGRAGYVGLRLEKTP